jgi:ectoine hydroxylase-related dioxygenase (phytanoyl-CoA dioxygenase family)
MATSAPRITKTSRTEHEVSQEDVEFFRENGWLKLENVFEPSEVAELSTELDRLMDEWAEESMGWEGDWREEYLDPDEREGTSLVALHDLQFYSEAFRHMVEDPRLITPITQIARENLELHHTTLHAKPPEKGSPFPMHQDWAFYKHRGGPYQYIDALVHIDDAPSEKGPLQFIEGSHTQGALDHIEGEGQAPHLPTDEYGLKDAVEVPANAGDVILMSYHTIHGSDKNETDQMRRIVRIGYKDPANEQFEGQAHGRDGIMVAGKKRSVDEE